MSAIRGEVPTGALLEAETPLVLVTVGSDHHRFDRLVDWVDLWLDGRRGPRIRCVVQHGTSKPPRIAEGYEFLEHDQLQELMRTATVVVTQGGPMSIVEARQAGRKPVVVPRSASMGEHVDDHQQAFCRRLLTEGLICSPSSQSELGVLLDAALSSPADFAAADDPDAVARVAATSDRFGVLVDQLVQRPQSARPRLMLIAGSGRSGSTLFERALGDVPGVVPVGETVHLWDRGLRDDELCGCGEAFSRCRFWGLVGDAAFGGWGALDSQEMSALRHGVVRTRYVARMLGPSRDVGWRLRRDRFARLLGALYRGILEVSGARLIVDSSKMPAYAALLRHAGVDLSCVYVVRDPRGVAHSWAKTIPRPEVLDGSSFMPRYGAAESTLWWSTFDVTFRLLARAGLPVTTVRYEDFVNDARGCVARTLAFAGQPTRSADLTHLQDQRVVLGSAHLVAGNPMRFRTGSLDLVRDEAWRQEMPARDRRTIEALSAGLRRRYGYR